MFGNHSHNVEYFPQSTVLWDEVSKKDPERVYNLQILKYYFVNLFGKTGIIIAINLSKQEAKG
jgi:hypothetical protein